jgi:DNA-binding PadR family transcriptional regulator
MIPPTDIGFRYCRGMKELFRGAVFLHILDHTAEEPIHGARMSADVSPGTLYPTLHRMETGGLFVSARSTVDGRVLRTYTATEAGREALRKGHSAIRVLASEVLPPQITSGTETPDDHE